MTNVVGTLIAHRDELRAELQRVEQAIAVLSVTGAGTTGRPSKSKGRQVAAGEGDTPKPTRIMSEETRQKMREAQRRRWERRKVAPGEGPTDRK